MGDKTQLLAFALAGRYRAPWTVIAGIFVATVLNHSLAANFGGWVSNHISPPVLRIALAVSFIAFALWTLKPDDLDEERIGQNPARAESRLKAFLGTVGSFFLVEMGDKTQLATIALGAKYRHSILWVTVGTTAGMMVSDGLAVFLGQKLAHRFPVKWIRRATAAIFLILGVAPLLASASFLR